MDGFGGLRVVCFESRRAEEMARLVERHGGVPILAPSMREVPLGDDSPAGSFGRRLQLGEVDVLVLMTGVGTRALARAVAPVLSKEALAAVLGSGKPVVVARGPKPAAALRELGVPSFVSVPEPNTWREVLTTLETRGLSRPGVRIDVQEYGAPVPELYEALRAVGAHVTPIPVYRWALPEDTRSLRAAIHRVARGQTDVLLFTSRAQLDHVLIVAREEGVEERLRDALGRVVIGSIGPVCSEALRGEGWPVDVEPTHPKMGHLVKETAERAREVLDRKRAKAGRAGPS